MSEVKRAGQQMQKVTNGSAHTAKASGLKNQRSKPYDRPCFQAPSFFRTWPHINSDQGKQQQPEELSQDTIEEQVSEPGPDASVNLSDLYKQVEHFRAGQVRHHLPFWESLTNDPVILDAIKHHHIECEAEYPTQTVQPNKINFSAAEIMIIDAEIAKLVSKEVLQVTNHVPDGFVSNIFIRPKKDGAFRMILNLKPLNKFVDYHHFKMDTFRTALKLIRPGCFMASVDLKDAYYSIPIAEEDRKLLMFQWKGKYYQFTCLPNGLSSSPRIFTKILKPVYACLRSIGHTCMGRIDDSLLVGQSFNSCHRNIADTVSLFTNLGFTIHPVKSVLQPQQKIDFLGFVLDSIIMTVTLTDAKAMKVRSACQNLLSQKTATIRSVAQVVGFLVSSFPAVEFAEMHYRHLELDKILPSVPTKETLIPLWPCLPSLRQN